MAPMRSLGSTSTSVAWSNDAGGPGTASDQEIELDCDYNLRYDYVMRAITAITGYIEGGEPHKLIERDQIHAAKEGRKRGQQAAGSRGRRNEVCSRIASGPAIAGIYSRPRMKRSCTFFSRV